MNRLGLIITGIAIITTAPAEAKKLGKLIFEDDFEREESQELKDEPGNDWTTSSERTAKGYKQVDLVDGVLHIWMHPEANHATSVRHEMGFENGAVEMRFKLPEKSDSLKLNFADMKLKSVWAGHLFDVTVHSKYVEFEDRKTGSMSMEIHNARKEKSLTKDQIEMLESKKKRFKHRIKTGVWHDLLVEIEEDLVIASVDGEEVGRFRSEGFAHEDKALLRLLVPGNIFIDDVKVWRKRR
ncbi:MAG: hypothetical protein AAF571_15025 [Verrucomicrobiota bacterium]